MKSCEGYSLVETAIVLLVAALLIGGVFSGMTLQRSSQLQTMMKEYDTYVKAISEFQTKYNALPGDMGGVAGGPGGYDPATMWGATDGDGDGRIGSSTTAGVLSNQSEWFQAWKHLAAAGFIQGSYTGSGPPSVVKGVNSNVPSSAVKGAGWSVLFYLFPNNGTNSDGSGGALWMDNYGHILTLGAPNASTGYTSDPSLSTSEASAVDAKMDDGLPGTGKIRAWRTSRLPGCTVNDNTSQSTPTYATGGSSALTCSLVFIPGF